MRGREAWKKAVAKFFQIVVRKQQKQVIWLSVEQNYFSPPPIEEIDILPPTHQTRSYSSGA
jgi:hypothetical protein